MIRIGAAAKRRRSIKVMMRADLVDEAERLDVDVSEACENGLVKELSRAWLEENREAIESYNRYIREHGLPLADYRSF